MYIYAPTCPLHTEDGKPIANDLLTQILADGDTHKSMLKLKHATGKPPSAPEHLLAAEDRYQASLSWPIEPTADEKPLLDELQVAVAPALAGLPCSEWPDVIGSVRLLRFLRGFEFHVPSAAVAFRRMLDVRKTYAMDASHEKAVAMLAAVGPAGDLLPTEKSADIHKHRKQWASTPRSAFALEPSTTAGVTHPSANASRPDS